MSAYAYLRISKYIQVDTNCSGLQAVFYLVKYSHSIIYYDSCEYIIIVVI